MEKFSIVLADSVQGLGVAGQRVSCALLPSDVHDPTELPTYLAGYRPPQYRGDEASPPILVDNDEDKYRSFSSDDAFKRVLVKGSTTGAVPEVDPKSALDSYKVAERYVGAFIPRQTELQRGNAYNPIMAAMRRARRAIELDREIDVWTLLTTNANWNANNVVTLGATFNWNGGSASDPMADLQNMCERSAQAVTDIWMNLKVANAFLRHDAVRDHLRMMIGDSAAGNDLQRVNNQSLVTNVDFIIPGLPPIHVVPGKVLNETTSLLDFILSDAVVLTVKPPGVPSDGEEIATSYTFRRRGPSGVGFEAREFFLENRGPLGGTMVVVSMADIEKMTGATSGGLLKGVIA